MKKERIFIVCLVVIILSIVLIDINQLNGKSVPTNMKDYIGYTYENLPKKIKSRGIDLVLGENNQVLEILINRRGYTVDSVQIGDSIEKIYEVYPKEWIHTRKHTIQILYGKEDHYGIATDYIIYTISKDEQVQSILVGKTTPFLEYSLPESNKVTDELIQGEWVSRSGHKLTFNSQVFKDNYLDSLWDGQEYMILAPNTLMIYRQKGSRHEKVKLYFWILEKELYLFTIDGQGRPIKESIEVLFRV